jgi:hypothetical protein
MKTKTTARRRASALWGVLAAMLVACDEEPPILSEPIADIPAPTRLSARVGPTMLTLDWSFDPDFPYAGFIVYRSDDDQNTYYPVANVMGPPWDDTNVRVGVVYWYRVAGLDAGGIIGKRSAPVPARAATYAVFIEAGAEYTALRDVTLTFTAPITTLNVRYGEDSLMTGMPWLDFITVAPYRLSAGDGAKRVYAEFLDETGNPTHVVSSMIELDTFAQIASLSFACASACVDVDTIAPGGTVHFTLQPSGAERDGFARVFIEGQGENPVIVSDDGRFGDPVANNGIYEIDHVFPLFFRQRSMRMSAVFVDRAENESPEVEFAGTLYMSDPPAAVSLLPAADSTTTSITVRWTRSEEAHFARYEVYRDVAPPVSPSQSILAGQVTAIATTTFLDANLAPGTTYYYRVFVVNDLDERTASNQRQLHTAP